MSIKLNDDITLENIEYSNEYVDDYDTYDECAWGSVEVEITAANNKTGEVVKEVWVANGCKGSIEGLYVEKEHITADPYYSSPGSVEWDYIDWYDCNDGADWDKTISGPDDFWDDYQDDLEKVSDAIVDFVENGMKFKESCSSPKARFEEALTYKYRIVLDQPEGSNYRLTNSDKLKFKTEEDALVSSTRTMNLIFMIRAYYSKISAGTSFQMRPISAASKPTGALPRSGTLKERSMMS